MHIPFADFEARVRQTYPQVKQQIVPTSVRVHIYDARWLQEEFWPVWDGIVRAINEQIPGRLLENNKVIGICDEITARFKAELVLSTRRAHPKEDVGSSLREASVMISTDASLNRVDGFCFHRTTILGVTGNPIRLETQSDWQIVFAEPQLTYALFQTTPIDDAPAAGVALLEHWL